MHGEKSRLFDTVVRKWLTENPSGTIVELGAGLETQFHRLDNGTVSWVCVDLEEVIAVRGEFLAPTERCRTSRPMLATCRGLTRVEPGPVLITAQSFLMFLLEEQVRQLVVAIIDRFPGVEIVFDTVSPAISQKMAKGYRPTENYELPPAPWGTTSPHYCSNGMGAFQASMCRVSAQSTEPSMCLSHCSFGFRRCAPSCQLWHI